MSFITIAKVSEIPPGTMKHVEATGQSFALRMSGVHSTRSGTGAVIENARLSRGSLMDTIVTCPMHSSQFDVTTGKMMSGPVLELGGLKEMFTGCPDTVKKAVAQMFEGIAEEQRLIKTYDQPVYQVKFDGDDVQVQL